MTKMSKDFLTPQERKAHERAFARGDSNWSAPFEPWVIREWAKASQLNGWDKIAAKVRQNILTAIQISNDPNLTYEQKKQAISNLSRS